MSKLGIVGGCIYEFQRVSDWKACFLGGSEWTRILRVLALRL